MKTTHYHLNARRKTGQAYPQPAEYVYHLPGKYASRTHADQHGEQLRRERRASDPYWRDYSFQAIYCTKPDCAR